MRKLLFFTLVSFYVIGSLSGCVTNPYTSNQYMVVQDAKKQHYPAEGKALFLVERKNEINLAAYNMVVWDVTNPLQPDLIGYLAPTMKAAFQMEPGKRTLLVQLAATNNMMEIEVQAGKTYFTKIGTDGHSVYFYPVKQGMKNDMTRDRISVATPHLVAWGKDRDRIENSLQSRIQKGRDKMNEMDTKELKLRTMVIDDGR